MARKALCHRALSLLARLRKVWQGRLADGSLGMGCREISLALNRRKVARSASIPRKALCYRALTLPARSKPDSKGLSGVSKPTLRPCDDLGQEKFLCTPYQVSRLQGDLARPCATLPARIKLDGKGLSGPSEPTLRPCGDLGQENFFRTPPKLAVRRTTPVFLSTEYSLLHKSRVQKRVLVRISFCLGGQRWM